MESTPPAAAAPVFAEQSNVGGRCKMDDTDCIADRSLSLSGGKVVLANAPSKYARAVFGD